jgi:PKD repeat protein
MDPAWIPAQVPIATFKVSCNGNTCNLDASGSKDAYGTITSYAWSFGDGATAAVASVAHTYAVNGNYTVKLTVTDSNGATGTKFQTITVNLAASFTFSCSGLTCNFDGSASKDSNATIASYAWNFGDGLTGAGVIISHTYAVGNSYKVTLTITDSTGATDAQSQMVNNNSPPVASFTFTCNLLTCSFNGSGSRDPDGTIASYAWTLGDGTATSGPSVSHTYAVGGSYTVTLTVTDNAGATDAKSQTAVVNAPPVASFTFSCSRFTCSFDASGSYDSDGSITSFAWNFGDGTTLAGAYQRIGHTYPAPGMYTVTLTVTDNAFATDTTSKSVTIIRRR